jgi:hypothetical protein
MKVSRLELTSLQTKFSISSLCLSFACPTRSKENQRESASIVVEADV